MIKSTSLPIMIKAFQISDDVFSIVESIKEDIFLGILKPRERLVELSLSEKFNVNRSKLRKALMELERFGLVIIEPNKGAMVRDFTLNEIEQIIQMRKLLEEQAARSMSLPVTAEFLSDLMELQKQHEAAVTKEDMRNAFKLNKKFHDALYNLCENPYVVDLIKYFTTLLDAINSRMLFFRLIKNSPKTHLKIISALENEDRDELVYLLCVVKMKSADIYYHEMRKWWANEEEQPSF